ncbi:MAG: hypothetical protein LBE18_05695 [Planctomycetaceae bacterium]|jgi:hypothetical protein|nr:hypothetical protein [Planctomycetaceae bacterium]
MRIIVTIFILIFASLFFFGYGCRHEENSVVVSSSGGGQTNDPLRQAEDFLREIEILNSLEGSPCLPDSQGAEKIVQTGDRLNTWIKRKRADDSWKSEPAFIEIESAIRRGATNAESAVKLLESLQDKNAENKKDVLNPTPAKNSDTLIAECKAVVRHLAEIESVLLTLENQVGVTDLKQLSAMITGLKEKLAALDSITNLNANAIRAFVKQFEQESEQISVIAAYFKNFAQSMKTENLFIQTSDVYHLIQSIWLRDISNWARGDKQDILERVKNLFDWTICNIAIRNKNVVNNITLPVQLPWQSILLGNASELDRAWVFVELLRQQRIDAVMLAVEDDSKPNKLFVWGVGVLLDGEIYVFIPEYGTPLPAKDSLTFADNGTLICRNVATLSQVLNDDSLLRQLDISDTEKFPITAEKLKKSTLFIVALPETVSMRMKVLEADLSGGSNMILYSNINEQRKLLSEIKSTSGMKVEVWNYPLLAKFDQLFKYMLIGSNLNIFWTSNPVSARRGYPLWSGRILYFKGEITGQNGAMTYYQDARISDRELMDLRANPDFRNDKKLSQILQLTTNQAVFWIGIASFQRNSIENAKDSMKGLMASPVNLWTISEAYILGRIAEQEKNYEEAINYYEMISKGSTQLPTFAIRAKWIREKTKKQK